MRFDCGSILRGMVRFAFLLVLMVRPTLRAHAQTETVLYSFCTMGAPCADGANPYAGLIRDAKGNLYGTTFFGGAYGQGAVFELTKQGTEIVLYSFCPVSQSCVDGAGPGGGLVRDSAGNLYGTTIYGGGKGCGAQGCGTVFMISPIGKETVLYSFSGGADGTTPSGYLVRDSKGNLYGETELGAGPFNCGTVFKLSPTGTETVLHTFGFSDGCNPVGGLVRDSKGNLYGATAMGGANNPGAVFKVSSTGAETVLYSFGGFDGENPAGGLVRDSKGNLYGVTSGGGANFAGVVYEVTPTGTGTVLYNFTGGADGKEPEGTLVRDKQGNLYGTTSSGGTGTQGTVFELTSADSEIVLHTFGNTNGAFPVAGLVRDSKGNLYGTTAQGGTYNSGTVFKVTPQ